MIFRDKTLNPGTRVRATFMPRRKDGSDKGVIVSSRSDPRGNDVHTVRWDVPSRHTSETYEASDPHWSKLRGAPPQKTPST